MSTMIGGRAATVVAAAATAVAGLAVSAVPSSPLTTAFLLLAPALPAAVMWRSVPLWERLLLAGSAALVIDAVVAEVMVAGGFWTPSGGVVAVAVISAVMWIGNTAAWNALAGDRQERTS
jgi:hypothetical protein